MSFASYYFPPPHICLSCCPFVCFNTQQHPTTSACANIGLCQYLRTYPGVWSNQFQRHEVRRTFTAPQQRFVAVAADHDFDDQPTSPQHYRANPNWAPQHQYQSSYVAPVPSWVAGSRFQANSPAAVPNNWYLPVAPQPDYHQFIVRPHQPWMRQVVRR